MNIRPTILFAAEDGTGAAAAAVVAPAATGVTIATAPVAPVVDPAKPAATAAADPANVADPAADPAKVEAAKVAAAAATAAADAAAKAALVPEKYEFQAPEGVTYDPAQVEAFTPIAKELGLTNDQAQKLVNLQHDFTKASAERWTAQVTKWGADAKADKDFGGANFDKNVGLVAKSIDKFGSPGLRKALDDSGMGNHPDVLKFFRAVGEAIGSDTITVGNSGGGDTPRTAAQILYPNLK